MFSLRQIVGDPLHDSVEDVLFACHVQFVAGDDVDELIDRQAEELFALLDIDEVLLRVAVGNAQQFAARVRVGEGANAETISRIELFLQELAAGYLNFFDLNTRVRAASDLLS